MAAAKSILKTLGDCFSVDDPVTPGKRLLQANFVACTTANGNRFDSECIITIDPADTSAVIREKMINAIIAGALLQDTIVLREDIVLPTYSTGESTSTAEVQSTLFISPATGNVIDSSLRPLTTYSLTVTSEGLPIAWDVRLEGSLDGIAFTTILRHTQVLSINETLFSGSNRSPSLFIRCRCVTLSLGLATNVTAVILGVP